MKSPLDTVYIAAPCSISWSDMEGDDRIRMCSLCSKNVYNISDMTKTEAEKFLIEHGVSACLKLARRKDGTIITDNCPVGLRRIRNSIRSTLKMASAAVACLVSSIFAVAVPAKAQIGEKPESDELLGYYMGRGSGILSDLGVGMRPLDPDSLWRRYDLREKAEHSAFVVVAAYKGCESVDGASSEQPKQAKFQVVKTFKGPVIGPDITVRYDLAARNPGTAHSVRSLASSLPAEDETVILFLNQASPKSAFYETYQGPNGRVKTNLHAMTEASSIWPAQGSEDAPAVEQRSGK